MPKKQENPALEQESQENQEQENWTTRGGHPCDQWGFAQPEKAAKYAALTDAQYQKLEAKLAKVWREIHGVSKAPKNPSEDPWEFLEAIVTACGEFTKSIRKSKHYSGDPDYVAMLSNKGTGDSGLSQLWNLEIVCSTLIFSVNEPQANLEAIQPVFEEFQVYVAKKLGDPLRGIQYWDDYFQL